MQRGQEILGDRILGFQAGNEPDLYVNHGRRPEVSPVVRMSPADQRLTHRQGYGPVSYKGELGSLLNTMRAQGLKTQNQLISPSVNVRWTFQEVIDAGLLTDFGNEVGILSVEK